MATGSLRFVQYVRQDNPNQVPNNPLMTRLRTTGGSGITNSKTNLTSNELRSDRQIVINRNGQNQPDISVPFEFSWDSFDPLIQGAMGSPWVGGASFDATVSVSTAGVVTLGTGTWADYDVNEGDYILFNGSGNTNEIAIVHELNGAAMTLYEIGGTALTTGSATTELYEFTTGHYADIIDATSISFTVAATTGTITRASGSWLTLGVEKGDKIFFKGFAQSANNGWHEVTGVTATVLTVSGSLTNETLSSGDLSLITNTGFITVGVGLDYFTIEEGFTDITTGKDYDGSATSNGVYHYIVGARASSFALNVQPDAIVTGEFGFMGQLYSNFQKDSIADGVVNPNINPVFDSFTGSLSIPDASDIEGVVTGLNFTLDNSLIRRYALMDKNAKSIGEGRANLTGTLNAYFANADMSNIFEKETIFNLNLRMVDLDGNAYVFGFPRTKLTSDSRDVTENDVTQSVGFAALGGSAGDKKKTIYVLRQPALEA